MSTTTPVETVAVPRETVIEAVSALMAVYEVLVSLNGATDLVLAEIFSDRAWPLRDSAFPELFDLQSDSADDNAYATHPVVVETNARSHELAAEALRELHRPTQLERTLSDEEHYWLKQRAQKLAKYAKEVRAAGTIDVRFPES